jgi:DNA (cytosine-5)-methyltransferase 1
MMFNGAGRPICLDVPFPTLAASTGGNKTHFLDENEMFRNLPSFVERYHAGLMAGHPPQSGDAPRFLRRLTLSESMAIQTFPADFEFRGSRSAQYRQIGNAVPCALAEVVARCIREAVLVPAISLAA